MMLVIGRDWLNSGAVRYGGEFAGEGCLRCIAMCPHRVASARAAAPCAILHRIISKTRKHFMIIEFKGMRPDVEKAAFTEEELQRQKKNAAVYADDADEYANNIKIIG